MILGLAEAQAADVPDVTMHAVASGERLRVGFAGRAGRVVPETIYLKADNVRMEFQDGADSGYLLSNAKGAWLISKKAAMAWPMPARGAVRAMRLDSNAPCAGIGNSHCEPAGARQLAGRRAMGWHFSHAGSSGPDGSDRGNLWIDADTGVLLGYDAQDIEGHGMRWTVTDIQFTPLPDSLFSLPDPKVAR